MNLSCLLQQHKCAPPPRTAAACVNDDDDAQTFGCGWFDSSHELKTGLTVREYVEGEPRTATPAI